MGNKRHHFILFHKLGTLFKVQAFLDFCGFQFNAVYNSILFSSPLVLLSNLDLRDFCFPQFFNVSPHQQCKLRNACLVIVKNHQIWVVKTSMSMTSKNIQVDNLYIVPFISSIYQKLFYNVNISSLFSAALPNYICTSKNIIGKKGL